MPSLSPLVIRLPKASLCEPAAVFCDGVSGPANPTFGTPKELTLAIESPLGLVLVVGCSHPGVEKILNAASAGNSHVLMLLGGLHLVKTPDPEIERLANALHDKWKIDRIAPGHSTGEPALS
jgi:metal-dependent hydrolase (beta-lactamase superfamily II)